MFGLHQTPQAYVGNSFHHQHCTHGVWEIYLAHVTFWVSLHEERVSHTQCQCLSVNTNDNTQSTIVTHVHFAHHHTQVCIHPGVHWRWAWLKLAFGSYDLLIIAACCYKRVMLPSYNLPRIYYESVSPQQSSSTHFSSSIFWWDSVVGLNTR